VNLLKPVYAEATGFFQKTILLLRSAGFCYAMLDEIGRDLPSLAL